MTNQPLNPAALRGAVDLSSLKKPNPPAGGQAHTPAGVAGEGRPTGQFAGAPGAGTAAVPDGGAGAPGTRGGESSGNGTLPGDNGNGLIVEATAANFSQLMQLSMTHPVVLTVWAASQPASRGHVDALAQAVHKQDGRMLLAIADVETSPEIAQMFAQLGQQAAAQGQPMQVLAAAFVQGQPIPLPAVTQPQDADELLSQIAQIAVQNGLSGRVASYNPGAEGTGASSGASDEPELPALHKAAYDAIDNGDLDGALASFEQALKENPQDEQARLALGQVKLMKRTQGADLQRARDAAAANPSDIDAQLTVADLDLLGGHVEDAFSRLVDVVKATSGDERNTVREHLIELFDVVGATDPRVKRARTALMSALY